MDSYPLQTNHPGLAIARRVLNETHPHHRKKIISNFIVNQLLVGTNRRKAFEAEKGFYPPDAMLISPTMRCNLHCYGCYAAEYSTEEDLPFEVMDRLVGECKEMGIHLVLMTGGEPFLRKDLFDLFEKTEGSRRRNGIDKGFSVDPVMGRLGPDRAALGAEIDGVRHPEIFPWERDEVTSAVLDPNRVRNEENVLYCVLVVGSRFLDFRDDFPR
jgi:hypothetical protein